MLGGMEIFKESVLFLYYFSGAACLVQVAAVAYSIYRG